MTDADALREAMARAAVLVMAEARYERLCAIRDDTDETRPPLDSYEPTRDQEAARVVDAALSAAKVAGWALVPVEATEGDISASDNQEE